jgi:hypothetical protein
VVAPAEQILASLGRLLVESLWLLDLDRAEQPLADGPSVGRWRSPSAVQVANAMESSGHLPALCYRAAVLGIAPLHTMVVPRPEHGPEVRELLIAMDLRAAPAKRTAQLASRPAVVGASVGAAAVSVTALMGGLVSVAGASALGGATAAAIGEALFVRPVSAWRYRSALAVLHAEVQTMAASVRVAPPRCASASRLRVARSPQSPCGAYRTRHTSIPPAICPTSTLATRVRVVRSITSTAPGSEPTPSHETNT